MWFCCRSSNRRRLLMAWRMATVARPARPPSVPCHPCPRLPPRHPHLHPHPQHQVSTDVLKTVGYVCCDVWGLLPQQPRAVELVNMSTRTTSCISLHHCTGHSSGKNNTHPMLTHFCGHRIPYDVRDLGGIGSGMCAMEIEINMQ